MLDDLDVEALRARVRDICLALPGAAELRSHSDHSGFAVGPRKFAYFLNNHHGDSVVGLTCKALPGVQGALIDLDRERFYLPAYMHHHGWIGMRLDQEPIDWAQVEGLLFEAWTAMAPQRLLKQRQVSGPRAAAALRQSAAQGDGKAAGRDLRRPRGRRP